MAIFMIGAQRSGSNLLHLMLNQLPEIAAPHPPHILQKMTPLISTYGNLDKNKNFIKLIEDVCRLVELNPIPWESVDLDPTSIMNRVRVHSLIGILEAVYDQMAESSKATTWCCKSLANIKYLPTIETYFRNAKYIYLYRDGRDIAVSFQKSIIGEKHYYHIAKEWARTQRLALMMAAHIGEDRFFKVKYENMISNPESIMKNLCAFLDFEYYETMLESYKSDDALNTAESGELLENAAKPIMKENAGKYYTEATENDTRIFESVAGEVLDALGYKRSIVPCGEEEHYRSDQIRLFDEENEHLKQQAQARADDSGNEGRDKQSRFLASIMSRQDSVSDEWLSHIEKP